MEFERLRGFGILSPFTPKVGRSDEVVKQVYAEKHTVDVHDARDRHGGAASIA
jgi:hypothetical protein